MIIIGQLFVESGTALISVPFARAFIGSVCNRVPHDVASQQELKDKASGTTPYNMQG